MVVYLLIQEDATRILINRKIKLLLYNCKINIYIDYFIKSYTIIKHKALFIEEGIMKVKNITISAITCEF